MLRVGPGSIVDPSGRDQHAYEVRGDSGIAGRKAECLGIVSFGGFEFGVECGDDRESVRDPGGRGRVLPGRSGGAEVALRRGRIALDERSAPGAEQRLRL